MAKKQVYYEDVEIGTELTPLHKVATTMMLVKWAGAYGDFMPLHYDEFFTSNQGINRRIIHGPLKRQWLIQLVTDWAGDEGRLRTLSCKYRAMDHPRNMKTFNEPADGETWLCKGVVTDKSKRDLDHLVSCDIWVENGKGEKTTIGKAVVALPSRKS